MSNKTYEIKPKYEDHDNRNFRHLCHAYHGFDLLWRELMQLHVNKFGFGKLAKKYYPNNSLEEVMQKVSGVHDQGLVDYIRNSFSMRFNYGIDKVSLTLVDFLFLIMKSCRIISPKEDYSQKLIVWCSDLVIEYYRNVDDKKH